jgi:hypothetical protein
MFPLYVVKCLRYVCLFSYLKSTLEDIKIIYRKYYLTKTYYFLKKNLEIELSSALDNILASNWSRLSTTVTTLPVRTFWQIMYTNSLSLILSDTYENEMTQFQSNHAQ